MKDVHSPHDHYRLADELLSCEVVTRDPTLPIARAKVAQAQVHALLAQCDANDYLAAKYISNGEQVSTLTTFDDRL